MKCYQCGADYSSDRTHCPYCNAINRKGMEWQRQYTLAEEQLSQSKERLTVRLLTQTTNKILNRIILVELAVFALVFGIMFVYFFSQEMFTDTFNEKNAKKIHRELEKMYDKEQFGEMYDYLDEKELFGKDKYYKYSQISLLYYDYVQFLKRRMDLVVDIEAGKPLSYYRIDSLLDDMNELITEEESYGVYAKYDGTNKEYLEKYIEEVRDFARGYLHLNEDEMELISQGFIRVDEMEELIDNIVEREGWQVEFDR